MVHTFIFAPLYTAEMIPEKLTFDPGFLKWVENFQNNTEFLESFTKRYGTDAPIKLTFGMRPIYYSLI